MDHEKVTPVNETLESFHKTYETDVREIGVRGRRFRFFVPRHIEPFVNPDDVMHDFPLWSKIWEASLVLSDHIAGLPPVPGRRFLEIGAGIGVVGIVAATFGHEITMTEHNPHALQFAGANALENGLADIEIMDLDWNHPTLEGAFDCIVGSEVVYRERDFEALEKLFRRLLKPEGEILLAEGIRKTSMEFFARMQERYRLEARKKVLRSEGREVPVVLCTMRLP